MIIKRWTNLTKTNALDAFLTGNDIILVLESSYDKHGNTITVATLERGRTTFKYADSIDYTPCELQTEGKSEEQAIEKLACKISNKYLVGDNTVLVPNWEF